jgi:hypothetical protein
MGCVPFSLTPLAAGHLRPGTRSKAALAEVGHQSDLAERYLEKIDELHDLMIAILDEIDLQGTVREAVAEAMRTASLKPW